MTTIMRFAFRWPLRLERLQNFRHRRSAALVTLAILILAVPAASTPRFDRLAIAAPIKAPILVSPVTPHDSVATPAPRGAVSRPNSDMDAVAGVVARKYRISQEATRELVGTAYREGGRNGLDPMLIIAVMAVESRFNPIAQSDGGAMGLMQVIPRFHADKFDASRGESVLDPHTNIKLGARVLKEYIRRGGTEVAGLQLYNGSTADASNAYANRVLGERQ